MDVLDKILLLTDPHYGLNIPMTRIAKYCKCTPRSLYYNINGETKMTEAIRVNCEAGLQQFLTDITEVIGSTESDSFKDVCERTSLSWKN